MSERLIGPLEIESLAFGGNGVARFDGRVIFVRGAVPGDLVWARLTKEKKRYAEGGAVRFEQEASQRCEPACPVFGECGGCQWQMLPYAAQLEHKEQIFRDALQRQCGVDPQRIAPILASPDQWYYRSRVQFKCRALSDGTLAIGFYRHASHFVIDIDSCPVAAPAFNKLLPALRELLQRTPYAAQVSQIDMEIGAGESVRLVLHYAGDNAAGLAESLRHLQKIQPLAIFLKTGPKSNLRHVEGPAELKIEVDSPTLELAYGAGGFAQINLTQNQRMVAEALRLAAPEADWRVLDLYCGMGNFSLPFARRVESLVAVEEHAGSIRQGKSNARHNRLTNVDFVARPAEGAYAAFAGKRGFDLVILDPPRAGAKEVVVDLLRQRVKRILYVSCDPMTLARDLKLLLAGGYRVIESRPLDMFPQTYHLESLTLLELHAAG
jgi:23S rRNA (uracil1939-C5)-methyltransferase